MLGLGLSKQDETDTHLGEEVSAAAPTRCPGQQPSEP